MGFSQENIMQTKGNIKLTNIDGVLVLKNRHDV